MYWLTADLKMTSRGFGAMLIASVLLLACESERQPATFYPIDSLVTAQIHLLTRIDAGLEKHALLDGTLDTVVYRPSDTTAWARELDIFRQLSSINKPVNRESYRVTDGLKDLGSNLTIKEFKSLGGQPIVYLKVYYQDNPARPRKIEALYEEANLMFSSTRQLTMRFDQIGDETVLTAYSVNGGQKMILSDSISFHINGKVLVD